MKIHVSPEGFRTPGSRLGCVGLLLGLVGCSENPEVELCNDASRSVSNIVLSGSGFSERLGWMAEGEVRRVRLQPTADSGLRVEFEAGGRKVDSGAQGYFEAKGGYRLKAVIGTNLDVQVSDRRFSGK